MIIVSSTRRSVRFAALVAACLLLPLAQGASLALANPPSAGRGGSFPSRTQSQAKASLEALITTALSANPELAAARSRLAAARQRPAQAHALPDPSLELVVRNVGFPESTIGSEMMSITGIGFTQALPAAGKRPLRRAVAEQGIDVAAARIESVRRRLIRDVATAFYELAFVTEAIRVVDETKRLLTDLEVTAESRYAVGDGIQQDVLKAQVEISVLLNRLIQLLQQRSSIETHINRLLGRSPSDTVGDPESETLPQLDLDLDALQRAAASFSAVLTVRSEQIEHQLATVELARKETKPDFVLGGSWIHRGALPDMWQLNLAITLPIRKQQRQNRAIEESLQELGARRHERADAGLAVAERVRDSYLQVNRSVQLIALFRDGIIPQALLSLESAMAGYSVGKVDFLTVLNNVITLLTYRLELERQTASAMASLAELEEHVGRTLGATPGSVWQDTQPPPAGEPAPPDASGSVAVNAISSNGENR